MRRIGTNIVKGSIASIERGGANALVTVDLHSQGAKVEALVALASVETLGLADGLEVMACFSDTDVSIGPRQVPQSDNSLQCRIQSIVPGAANADIVLALEDAVSFHVCLPLETLSMLGIREGQDIYATVNPSDIAIALEDSEGYKPPPEYYAYILVNSGAVAGLGHGALAVSKGDAATVYSFVGSPDLLELGSDADALRSFLVTGVDARLEAYKTTPSAIAARVKIGVDTYDKIICVKISEPQYNSIVEEACSRIVKHNTKYSLLDYNCMDCALDLLACSGIEVEWGNKKMGEIDKLVNHMVAMLGQSASDGLNDLLESANGDFTVPISVYDEFICITGEYERYELL